MAVAEQHGLPLALYLESASPHEVMLVHDTLACLFVAALPKRLIGDKAYDSDPLDRELAKQGIEMIAPHRMSRKKPPTQDQRKLRRYRHRWKVERLFSWLQNFRRIVVRHERYATNYLGMVQLACILILFKQYL